MKFMCGNMTLSPCHITSWLLYHHPGLAPCLSGGTYTNACCLNALQTAAAVASSSSMARAWMRLYSSRMLHSAGGAGLLLLLSLLLIVLALSCTRALCRAGQSSSVLTPSCCRKDQRVMCGSGRVSTGSPSCCMSFKRSAGMPSVHRKHSRRTLRPLLVSTCGQQSWRRRVPKEPWPAEECYINLEHSACIISTVLQSTLVGAGRRKQHAASSNP